MNILAHLILSGHEPDVMFGNFIGDAVKGQDWKDWDHKVQGGLLLHRHIDDFTDHHEEALKVRRGLAEDLNLYAPVALDILFDHALSIKWNEFYSIDRVEFIRSAYDQLTSYRTQMPDDIAMMFDVMKEHDWLQAYSTEDGILSALKGLSRRVRSNPPLHLALNYFNNHRNEVFSHFHIFYEDLKYSCEAKLTELLKID